MTEEHELPTVLGLESPFRRLQARRRILRNATIAMILGFIASVWFMITFMGRSIPWMGEYAVPLSAIPALIVFVAALWIQLRVERVY